LAALASPTTLLMTVCVSWLRRPANWKGWWSMRIKAQLSGVSNAPRPFLEFTGVPFIRV
jgi:hypothetical protein